MLATLISVFLSAYVFYFGMPGSSLLLSLAVPLSIVLFSFAIGAWLVSWLPLQKGEQNLTPRLFELYRKDGKIRLIAAFLFCIPLIILGISFFPYVHPLMILAFGLGIDALHALIYRMMDYLNPFRVVELMQKEAFQAVDKGADSAFCGLIEGISEVAVKALQRHNSALANSAIDALEKCGEQFLRSSKSLSHPVQSAELKAEGVSDSLSYVLLFLLQHLESIYALCLDKKLEMTAGHVMTTLTKLAIYTTRIDLSLTSLPLFYVDKLALQGVQRDFPDVGVKAAIGLMDVAEAIRQVKDLAYMDIKPSFITIISTLDNIAKETFKKDKSTKIELLTHPFRELGALIDKEPIKGHQDYQVISDQINHVLGEFATLEAVLTSMPPLPELTPEA